MDWDLDDFDSSFDNDGLSVSTNFSLVEDRVPSDPSYAATPHHNPKETQYSDSEDKKAWNVWILLPVELQKKIFGYLGPRDKLSMERVSRECQRNVLAHGWEQYNSIEVLFEPVPEFFFGLRCNASINLNGATLRSYALIWEECRQSVGDRFISRWKRSVEAVSERCTDQIVNVSLTAKESHLGDVKPLTEDILQWTGLKSIRIQGGFCKVAQQLSLFVRRNAETLTSLAMEFDTMNMMKLDFLRETSFGSLTEAKIQLPAGKFARDLPDAFRENLLRFLRQLPCLESLALGDLGIFH